MRAAVIGAVKGVSGGSDLFQETPLELIRLYGPTYLLRVRIHRRPSGRRRHRERARRAGDPRAAHGRAIDERS